VYIIKAEEWLEKERNKEKKRLNKIKRASI